MYNIYIYKYYISDVPINSPPRTSFFGTLCPEALCGNRPGRGQVVGASDQSGAGHLRDPHGAAQGRS